MDFKIDQNHFILHTLSNNKKRNRYYLNDLKNVKHFFILFWVTSATCEVFEKSSSRLKTAAQSSLPLVIMPIAFSMS